MTSNRVTWKPSKHYYIYKYEVTNQQYKAFITCHWSQGAPPHWKGMQITPQTERNIPLLR